MGKVGSCARLELEEVVAGAQDVVGAFHAHLCTAGPSDVADNELPAGTTLSCVVGGGTG